MSQSRCFDIEYIEGARDRSFKKFRRCGLFSTIAILRNITITAAAASTVVVVAAATKEDEGAFMVDCCLLFSLSVY